MTILVFLAIGCIAATGSAVGRIDNSQFRCSFDAPCPGWHNVTPNIFDDALELRIDSGVMLDAWHSIPRAVQGNKFAYAMNTMELLPRFKQARLESDTLPCLHGELFLTFFYWKNGLLSRLFPNDSPFPSLAVGVEPLGDELRTLHTMPATNKWGWNRGLVQIPSTERPFKIVFNIELNNPFDIVALDDISLIGDLSKATSCRIDPQNDDFSQSLSSVKGSNPLLMNIFKMATNFFAKQFVQPTTSLPVVYNPRQVGNNIRRKVPNTKKPRVITQVVYNPDRRVLSGHFADSSEQSNGRAFIQATTTTTTHTPTTTPAPTEVAMCEGVVSCGFEVDSCSYESTTGTLGGWIAVEQSIGSSLTGVQRPAEGDFFVSSFSSTAAATHVLRSSPFTILTSRASATLQFSYLMPVRAPINARLLLCDNGPDICFWDSTAQRDETRRSGWNVARVTLRSGAHRAYFIVEDLPPDIFIALDNITLTARRDVVIDC